MYESVINDMVNSFLWTSKEKEVVQSTVVQGIRGKINSKGGAFCFKLLVGVRNWNVSVHVSIISICIHSHDLKQTRKSGG